MLRLETPSIHGKQMCPFRKLQIYQQFRCRKLFRTLWQNRFEYKTVLWYTNKPITQFRVVRSREAVEWVAHSDDIISEISFHQNKRMSYFMNSWSTVILIPVFNPEMTRCIHSLCQKPFKWICFVKWIRSHGGYVIWIECLSKHALLSFLCGSAGYTPRFNINLR